MPDIERSDLSYAPKPGEEACALRGLIGRNELKVRAMDPHSLHVNASFTIDQLWDFVQDP